MAQQRPDRQEDVQEIAPDAERDEALLEEAEDAVNDMIKKKQLPAPPMALATAPVNDPELERILSAEVASQLIARAAGKRIAFTVARRTPIVGGVIGLSADAYQTWRIGRYADRELLPRAAR